MNGKLIGDKPCKVSLEPHVIVIDNLPEGMQVDDLVKLYSSYGDIQDANIEMVSEGSIRFLRGYIGFLGIQAANNATRHTNGRSIHGHSLTISMAPEGFVIPHSQSPRNRLPNRSQERNVPSSSSKPEQTFLQKAVPPPAPTAQITVLPAGIISTPERVPETCTSVLVQGQEGLNARTLGQLLRPCGRVRQIDQLPEGFAVKTDGRDTVLNVLDYCCAPITDGRGQQWRLVVQPIVGEEIRNDMRNDMQNDMRNEMRSEGRGRGRGRGRREDVFATKRGKNNRGNGNEAYPPRNYENRGNTGRGRGRGEGFRGKKGRNDGESTVLRMPGVTSWEDTGAPRPRRNVEPRASWKNSRKSDRPAQPVMPGQSAVPNPPSNAKQVMPGKGKPAMSGSAKQVMPGEGKPAMSGSAKQVMPGEGQRLSSSGQEYYPREEAFATFPPYQPLYPSFPAYQPVYQPMYQPMYQGYLPYQPVYPPVYQPLLQESEAGLLVEELDPALDEAAVRGIFRPFGPIQRVQFVDAGVAWVFSRRVRRSAVYFVRASDAVTAKKAMNGRDIEGARIRITRLVKDGGEAPAKPVAPTTL